MTGIYFGPRPSSQLRSPKQNQHHLYFYFYFHFHHDPAPKLRPSQNDRLFINNGRSQVELT